MRLQDMHVAPLANDRQHEALLSYRDGARAGNRPCQGADASVHAAAPIAALNQEKSRRYRSTTERMRDCSLVIAQGAVSRRLRFRDGYARLDRFSHPVISEPKRNT